MLNFENFLYVLKKHDLPLADSIQETSPQARIHLLGHSSGKCIDSTSSIKAVEQNIFTRSYFYCRK